MSVRESSGQNLNPTRSTPDRRPNYPDYLAGTLNSDIPPDPLLRPGSFIDATTRTSNATSGSGMDNPDGGAGRVKRKGFVEPLENWLPQGWSVEERVRASGATAGSTDRYYVDPVSGRRFRSKVEVLYFLETGTIKKKKTTENASGDKTSVEGSGSHKKKKSSTKPKSSALNFDFVNLPENVVWVLTDASAGSWTPFIGNKEVPESTTQEWAAAFTSVTSRK
ncbi:methyl-CpG-binding domain-containing protein 5 [Prunus yedoensis var. nudiflora]|uniref:Methyl-CpG-binding domain-containing protein 5 n=1 Tax=Prunus yedoensis var. nudiflora TaxID=2094558 RepID=A0A314Z3D9_PRUYE|nr:methyl-CpG-binding domain-containing protein 5 [Prunus yedoensis var. nudiflora]